MLRHLTAKSTICNLPSFFDTFIQQEFYQMLSERLFEDILVKYPELIEDRLKFIGRQVTHFGKRIDILFEDRFKEKLIIELKKNNLDRNALSQVMEYEGYILSEKDPCSCYDNCQSDSFKS